jgi:hypothetical protein
MCVGRRLLEIQQAQGMKLGEASQALKGGKDCKNSSAPFSDFIGVLL